MFQLNRDEMAAMRSQFVTASQRNLRYRPYAFTEHGAIMAATILNSPKAIEASVWVVRAFVRLRDALATNRLLIKRLLAVESKVGTHDAELRVIIGTLKQLMAPPVKKKPPIGFGVKEKKARYDGASRSGAQESARGK